jgi:acyl-CoA thioesterase-1
VNALFIAALLTLCASGAAGAEIFAIGTSNTNCKGVVREKSFTVELQALLRREGFDVTVTNSGVDGDKPLWMANRLFGPSGISANTKLVIFEPGPNDKNKSANVHDSEQILARLQERGMPTLYVSNSAIQSREEAKQTAEKYGARYYNHWSQGVPFDRQHRQYDMPGGGHLTGEGCQLVARNMLPFVRTILLEIGIKPAATALPPS